MGMLKSISLENYKSFQKLMVENKDELEIAPLTILCGVNSSGKSSILKSLLMLKQSYENNNATNFMTFNGDYVDNGSFNELLCDNTTENFFIIKNKFEITSKEDTISRENTDFRDLSRLFHNKSIESFKIDLSLKIINGDGFINPNRISEYKITINTITSNDKTINSSIELKKQPKGNKYFITCKNIPDVSGKLGKCNMSNCKCYFSNMSLESIYKEDIINRDKLLIPSIISIFKIVTSQYDQIQYIAPLRETPKRNYIIDKDVISVGITGENTALLLQKMSNKKTKWKGILPPQDENDFTLTENSIIDEDFENFVLEWVNYFNLGRINIDNKQKDLIKLNVNTHNIADVGFGVSQSLPILIEGLFMPQKQTLLLEQPEIHLHPKMQMNMADFLLSLAIQDKQVIVETHSDHIINRLIRRYMEHKHLRNKIKIYFIDKNESGLSCIEPIEIDEVKGAICENENFFYQFASETERIIDVGYRNLKSRQEKEENNRV